MDSATAFCTSRFMRYKIIIGAWIWKGSSKSFFFFLINISFFISVRQQIWALSLVPTYKKSTLFFCTECFRPKNERICNSGTNVKNRGMNMKGTTPTCRGGHACTHISIIRKGRNKFPTQIERWKYSCLLNFDFHFFTYSSVGICGSLSTVHSPSRTQSSGKDRDK